MTCPKRPSPYQSRQVQAGQELDKSWQDPSLQHNIDAVVGTVRQVGDGPAGVREDFLVCVLQQADKSGEYLLHSLQRRGGVFVPAEVGHGPGDVFQEVSLQAENGTRRQPIRFARRSQAFDN